MADYKQILRLRAEGVSQRGIAEALGCSRNTVAAVFVSVNTAEVGFGEVAELGADKSRKLLLPDPSASVSEVPDQYSFFNEQYRRRPKATGASMRILRNPGGAE